MCAESGWVGACMRRALDMRQACRSKACGQCERRRVHECSQGVMSRGVEPAPLPSVYSGSVSRFLPSQLNTSTASVNTPPLTLPKRRNCYCNSTVILSETYRISSELRSQATAGPVSTTVGDHVGIRGAVGSSFLLFCRFGSSFECLFGRLFAWPTFAPSGMAYFRNTRRHGLLPLQAAWPTSAPSGMAYSRNIHQ